MAKGTRGRGPGDTRRPRRSRAFALALAVSLLAHLPLVPTRLGEWVRMALSREGSDYDDDAGALIPIDLDLLGKEPVPEAPRAPIEPSPRPVRGPSETDASDAGPPARTRPRPPPEPLDGGPDAGPDAGPPPPVRDPLSAAGGAGKIAAKDPNVQVLIAGKVLRKHELGRWFSRLLLTIPEWHGFFEGSPIDPIQDLDHLLITGPRLRSDSTRMVAVMDVNMPAARVEEALDQLVHRAGGVFLEDAPFTAARARVGGAQRVFAWLPQKRLLVVLPEEAMDQLGRLEQAKPFRSSAEGVVISLITPSRPFRDFFPIAESVRWLRFSVTPVADGGADVAIEAGDRSAGEAARDAAAMTRDFDLRRKVDLLGLTSMEIVDRIDFVAVGDVIRGRVHVPANKLRLLMAYIEQKAMERYDGGAGAAPP